MSNVVLDWRVHNPLYWFVRRYMNDKNIRYILLLGGSSSGKSYSVAQAITLNTIESGDNSMVLRKYATDIKDSTYSDFKGISSKFNSIAQIQPIINEIRINKNKIRFRGLDDSERIKGISSYKRVYLDELTDFTENDFMQIRKRLRGMEGQQIMASWNPISPKHWVKSKLTDNEIFTKESNSLTQHEFTKYIGFTPSENWIKKYATLESDFSYRKINQTGNTVLIKTTHRDNFWISGHPAGEQFGFYDKHTIADYEYDKINHPVNYKIYANGEYGVETEGLFFIPNKHYEIIDVIPEFAKKIPYGLDFGYDPDPVSINAHYYQDGCIYIDEKLYKTGYVNYTDVPDVPNIYNFFQNLKGYNNSDLIVADSAEPKSIKELRIKGLSVMPAKKGSDSILYGIKKMQGIPLKITSRSKNTIIEYENYRRLYDKLSGSYLNKPDKKCKDHSIDNTRYVVTQKDYLW